ncbi:MAG TPA: AAA family ATPase [Leptospiraceae bacterium]|nr:AAA family ATPase [Leptospiraceae bacterium]HMY29591.1 AAA family ATPase [Leptospiraceae bacterium]HMZ62919.1 AAA family ATPase [Leptospiraceae bacterium]HNA05970.1 AAA family ATPase [Leptospiraceae bacterium]HNB99479.1 AAA family ATPase [Leptospiraceae bacterium]
MGDNNNLDLPDTFNETVEKLRKKLITAVDTGNLADVKAILETGITPNFQLPDIASPINYAAARSSHDILELLLKHGSNPNFTTSGPVTTLGQACKTGRLDMVNTLLSWGAVVDGYSAEHKKTSLMIAAEMGRKDIVDSLLAAKADPNFKDKTGFTAYDYAQKNNHSSIVSLLAPLTRGVKLDDSLKVTESDLIGQEMAKTALKQVLAMVKVNEERKKNSLPVFKVNLHAVFSGNSGTGKTTFARYYADEIKKIGILPKAHLVEVSRVDLVGEYIGQSAPRTSAIIEKARGGILFIDEAYSLKVDKNDTLGQESINTLIKYMEDYRDELVIILAGYTDMMRSFLDLNPGLKSRIPNIVPFEDFSDEQIGILFDNLCSKHEMNISKEDRTFAIEQILIKKRGKGFGNAREVRNVFERAVAQHCIRLNNLEPGKITKENLQKFIYSDITADPNDEGGSEIALLPPVDPRQNPKSAIYKLHALRGMEEIKKEVQAMADYIRIRKLRKGASSSRGLQLHLIFTGNPGTGKTTVARLIGDIYRELGVLPSGHLVEVDRSGLIGGYLGQTAIKTKDCIEDARGGILFVDEAYSLFTEASSEDMYAREAVNTLLKYMEDYRDELVVIFAGYQEPMDKLMASSPGLLGRFSKTLVFPNFTDEELSGICYDICKNDGYELSEAAHNKLISQLLERKEKDSEFANARTVRNILEQAFKNQAQRIISLSPRDLMNRKTLDTIEESDIGNFTLSNFNQVKRVGFSF